MKRWDVSYHTPYLFHVKQFLLEMLCEPVGDGSPVPLAVRPEYHHELCICPAGNYDDTNGKCVGADDLGGHFGAGEYRTNAKREALFREPLNIRLEPEFNYFVNSTSATVPSSA